MSVPGNKCLGAPKLFAAPAGGARKRGRGCANSISQFAVALGAVLLSGAVSAQADTSTQKLQTGVQVTLFDVVDESPLYRVRYVAPGIGPDGVSFDAVSEDMERLCTTHALPYLRARGVAPATIVIALMQEPVEFGVMSPNVIQFFESYRIENDLCIWEIF